MTHPKLYAIAFGRRVALAWDGRLVTCVAGEVAKAVPIEIEYLAGDDSVMTFGRYTGTPKAVAKAMRDDIYAHGWLDVRVVRAKAFMPPPPPIAH
jgi:hypothetical protein